MVITHTLSKYVDDNKIKKIEKDLHDSNDKVKELFGQLKKDYIDWYGAKENEFQFSLKTREVPEVYIYDWLQSRTWNYEKQEITPIARPVQS